MYSSENQKNVFLTTFFYYYYSLKYRKLPLIFILIFFLQTVKRYLTMKNFSLSSFHLSLIRYI